MRQYLDTVLPGYQVSFNIRSLDRMFLMLRLDKEESLSLLLILLAIVSWIIEEHMLTFSAGAGLPWIIQFSMSLNWTSEMSSSVSSVWSISTLFLSFLFGSFFNPLVAGNPTVLLLVVLSGENSVIFRFLFF